MELEADDGCVIFIPRGCKKELGRGPGIVTQDRTVSRRQVLLEVQEPRLEDETVDNHGAGGRLNVQVLGPNPVCIMHNRQQKLNSRERQSASQEMKLVRKGETDFLSVGDKISLSIRLPFFFTVKEGSHKMKAVTSAFIERSDSTLGETFKEGTFPKVEDGNQATEDDLMAKWKARKKGTDTGHQDKQLQSAEGGGTSNFIETKEIAAKEEEDGMAEAVARRQKRAYERHQQMQQKQQDELKIDTVGTSNFVRLPDVPVSEPSSVDTHGIDPVKEFGFLVEGSEFEQYGKRHRPSGGKWHCSFSEDKDNQDEDREEKQVVEGQHSALSNKRKHKRGEDDEDWMGEDQEERLRNSRVKNSDLITKSALRSHKSSPSSSKKTPTKARGIHNADMASEEDEDDETLGGFIVNDDEEEEENLDEEEEWHDDDGDNEELNEEVEDSPLNKAQQQEQKTDMKPLCKYGKDCYRKNKEHREAYRH